mmetsp:Transcript_28202/g.43886  ORF Transcript_28202/g.43886 Transcript_28202/m.43886 type:complete len:95 (+) Transcript_28202:3906-4190(+)
MAKLEVDEDRNVAYQRPRICRVDEKFMKSSDHLQWIEMIDAILLLHQLSVSKLLIVRKKNHKYGREENNKFHATLQSRKHSNSHSFLLPKTIIG